MKKQREQECQDNLEIMTQLSTRAVIGYEMARFVDLETVQDLDGCQDEIEVMSPKTAVTAFDSINTKNTKALSVEGEY
jgi:hypothetical protein